MAMLIKSRVTYSVVVFIMSMILLFVTKPKLVFDSKGDIKNFGANSSDKETIYSLGVFTVIIAILVFYIFCVIDLVFD